MKLKQILINKMTRKHPQQNMKTHKTLIIISVSPTNCTHRLKCTLGVHFTPYNTIKMLFTVKRIQ